MGRAGLLHYGRTLVRLIHLVIVTGEVGFRKQDISKDFVTPHLINMYSHGAESLVSILPLFPPSYFSQTLCSSFVNIRFTGTMGQA